MQLLVSTGWKIRLLQQTQYEQVMPEGNLIPYYKNEILEQCKGSELKEIWEKWRIRAGDKKEDLSPISTRIVTMYRQFGQVEHVRWDLEN